MKQKKVVHIKKEKVLTDEDFDHKELTREELVKSARKTEQSTKMRSKSCSSLIFVEME